MTPRGWLCVCLGAVALTGCRQSVPPPLRPLNVVLVTLDTLRADRLGCYGYAKIETPNLDRFARGGTLFEYAVAQAPLTAPSHASIFTGLNPNRHGVRDTGGFILAESHATLAEILQRQGWDTAAFVGSSVLKKSFGFGRGFAVYDDKMPRPDAQAMAAEFPERRAAEVVDRAAAWLAAQSGKPFFLWVHLFDPHSPYDPPAPFRENYRGRLYDGEVAYTDQQLGKLFEALGRKSPENTLTAILSDHGESLGEHGEYTHGVFLYDATLRIAFLMAGPGVPAGRRVKQQVRSIDLLPTLLDLLGGQAPAAVEGVSLRPAFVAKALPNESYAETLYTKINLGWAELRAMRTDRWKYIRAPRPELYDLAADPAETVNVIGDHPEIARQLDAKLAHREPEKVQTTMVDRRTMEQLKSLGYLGGSSQGEYALTGRGIDPKDRTEVLRLIYLATSPDAGGASARSIPLLRQALAEDPTNPTLYYQLGPGLAATGRSAEAMKLYREGIANGVRTGWIYARLAHLYLKQGNRDEALAAYERAAQLNPSDSESLNDLGMLYLESGRVADAERAFQWGVAADSESALAHNGLGLVAVRKQDATAARLHFEKAVALDPDLVEAQLNLGRIYKMIGANTRARACFQAFLAKASPQEYGALIPKIREELKALDRSP
jgi:arylsulfatase A-like enzyme/Tfp pilus assembly protein PilF